jgi:hypothetical protein
MERRASRELARQPPSDAVEACARVIEREYREWPALSLTTAQMERLWAIDHALCEAAVNRLVERRQLRRVLNHTYVRQNRERYTQPDGPP